MQDITTALCIGNAVVDIFLQIPNDNPHFGLNKRENKLFLSYGEKIVIDKYQLEIGGNACNASVGLSRLGINTSLVAEIGNDDFGQKIIKDLNSEKVDNKLVIKDNDNKTSFSVGLNFQGERTLFVEHVERKHNFIFPEIKPKLVYLTSLGKIWQKAYLDVFEFAQKQNSLIAFNPGTIQIDEKGNIFWSILEKTDILIVNKEEAEKILYGKELVKLNNDKKYIKKLLFGLRTLGPKNVVITDSKNGSFLETEENESFYLKTLDVNVVEKTGAGDAYSAGFLAAFLSGSNLHEAMIWGTFNSTNVIQEIGAQKGLLEKNMLIKKMSIEENFTPLEI